ncbi:MAG: IclR family transcriptional regulator C-terminal domain-containing protein [Lacunisphaera sp.]|nr:IclR family transcriptional regulator C-terminal domain-containing protein [Lacunisphaera sp.]
MPRKTATQYNAPALEKGLDILEYLAGQSVERSQSDIVLALKRGQSEIYRMLACLEGRGFVIKSPASGTYRLSLRMFELAHRQNPTALLRQTALIPMDELADRTGQSVHLSAQIGGDLLVLVERMPARRICLAVGEGTTLPLSETASGKILLSRMPAAEAHVLLGRDPFFQGAAPAKKQAIRTDIVRAKEQGWLMVTSDVTPGAIDIAAAVGVAGTDTNAVIDLPFIVPAKGGNQITAAYVTAVRTCALQINRNIGIRS